MRSNYTKHVMVDQNIEQQSSEAIHSVENALETLWDKAREASLLISTLREEKKRLLKRIGDLEEEFSHMKTREAEQQALIETMRAELDADVDHKRGAIQIDQDEKRMLQQKIRNTISKIDQYLNS